jgi:uncharacterized protein (TIGR03435 family)
MSHRHQANAFPRMSLACFLCVLPAVAQTAFEAVSVKPAGSNSFVSVGPSPPMTIHQESFRYSGYRVTCIQPLRSILREAFALRDLQIEGPDWMASQLFQIDAVMPEGSTKEDARPMLQKMLADRFALQFHREQKDVPVYALVAAKGSSKLHAITDPNHPTSREMKTPMGTVTASIRQGRGLFTAVSVTMADFAVHLSNIVDRPVVDLTGIAGVFEIDLQWTPDPPGAVDTELLRTLERQLGLKLDARKLPYEILKIDRVEKTPTSN